MSAVTMRSVGWRWSVLACLLGTCHPALAQLGPDRASALPTLRVFVLAGQSNMEGQAVVDLAGSDYNQGRGTLVDLFRDPDKAARMQHLRQADGGWRVRDDVWVWYQREEHPLLAGPLGVGFAVYGGTHHFGPELQIGHVLGEYYQEPVFLIKTAWGGKSLAVDFRPPGAGGEVGPYYRRMIEQVRDVLEHPDRDLPALRGYRPQLEGFVWYHGWNDGCDPAHDAVEYAANLQHLIDGVRRDWQVPKLPVVIGELTGPWVEAEGGFATVRQAQAAVAALPEFTGSVEFVATHDFVRAADASPNPTHGHHEFGNAETYFLVGDALGHGMIRLVMNPSQLAERILDDSVGTTLREGWIADGLPQAAALLAALTRDLPASKDEEYRRIPWLWRLALAAGEQNNPATLLSLLRQALPQADQPLRDWQAVVIGGGLINGISRSGVKPTRGVRELWDEPTAEPDLRTRWERTIASAAAMADDADVPSGTRYDALRILGAARWQTAEPVLVRYLAAGSEPELQQGAVAALLDLSEPAATERLIAGLRGLSPENRPAALEGLLQTERTRGMLRAALQAGQVEPAWLNADQTTRLSR